MIFEPSLFVDVADAYSIENPAIVEKDYYAVKLLELILQLKDPNYDLVFSGGTCLSKAYQNTYRMSEDLDIKLVAKTNVSKSKARALRRNISNAIISSLEISSDFNLIDDPVKRNEGRNQNYAVEYPKNVKQILALRPQLKLEITESKLLDVTYLKSIRSMCAEVQKLPPEVQEINCVSIESIACEKFISLLRRTAMVARDSTRRDDNRLIRHIYDLHSINKAINLTPELSSMIKTVIDVDRAQFANQHDEFKNNPTDELKYGLDILSSDPIHKERYNKFIDPLVYHPSPATWDEALDTLKSLSDIWLD